MILIKFKFNIIFVRKKEDLNVLFFLNIILILYKYLTSIHTLVYYTHICIYVYNFLQ